MSSVEEQSSSSASPNTAFTTTTIKHLLVNDHINYQVIDNKNKRSTAQCWKYFGFPGALNSNDNKKFDIIPGFVSCKTCFDTYKQVTLVRKLAQLFLVEMVFLNYQQTIYLYNFKKQNKHTLAVSVC
jgi:hypothetical protein